MRLLITLVLLGITNTAMAQETVWALAETPSTRFADAETVGPTFDADDELTVLVREEDRLRVMKGSKFGWVAADAVTEVAPAKEITIPGLDALDLNSLETMFQQPPTPPTE